MNNTITFNPGLAYSEFQTIRTFYIIAACTAFAMSAYFVVGYFAGNLHVLTWDSSQWMQALPSVGLVAVMTAYQFLLYSQGDVAGGKKATIIAVCVAVAFSLLSEIGQGMERDSIRMETKSQQSPTYQAAIAALGKLSGTSSIGASPYAADIANAQMKYNQCLERLARGKEPHCEGSKGRLESYQEQEAAWANRASKTSTNTATTLLGQAKTLERDENNYHPLVKLIRELFLVSGTIGSFLLSLTLISFFEYAFHYLGGRYAKARQTLMHNGYDVTRKLRQPPRKHDGSMDTYSDKATSAPVAPFAGAADSASQAIAAFADKAEDAIRNAPEAIAGEMMQAQAARNQLHRNMQDKADRMADTLDKTVSSQPDKQNPAIGFFKLIFAEVKARVNNGMEPTLKNVESVVKDVLRSHQRTTGSNIQHVDTASIAKVVMNKLDKTVSIQPVPEQLPTQAPDISTPTPRMSVAETIRAIIDSVQKSGASSPADIQAATTAAYSNLFNPADFTPDDLQKIAAKITSDLKPAGTAFTPEPARPASQKTGATGLHNPDLGTAEEQHEIPLPQPPHAHVGGKSGQPHAESAPHAPHAHVEGIQPGTEEALKAATDAPVGSMVGCPQCGTQFKKRNPQHRFCCAQHRDAWHNERNPKKQQFLKNRNMLA